MHSRLKVLSTEERDEENRLEMNLNYTSSTAACAVSAQCTFTKALPAKVAPKNCQKGIIEAPADTPRQRQTSNKREMDTPQQIPHRSNRAFGHAEKRKTPQKPYFLMIPIIHFCRQRSETAQGLLRASTLHLASAASSSSSSISEQQDQSSLQ